jgi:predicted CoA-substrate-specific enzyme activase
MIYAGIDVGHLNTKAVVMRDGVVVGTSLIRSHDDTEAGASEALQAAVKGYASFEDIKTIVATGMGRKFVTFAHDRKSSPICLARGVNLLYPSARTVFDVGAESTTVVRVSDRGVMEDAMGQDHCASGTGVFIEQMANLLQMSIGDMAKASLDGRYRAEVSSMCAVFAEQEVITHVHRVPPTPRNDLIKGIFGSMAVRIVGIGKRIGIEKDVVMVGGVALNSGFVHELEEEVKSKIAVLPNPQFVAAFGAACIAQEGG